MSDLSIEEIIKQAEKIKAEAEKQLLKAEKSLNEKAKNAIEDVVVDEQKVMDKIASISASNADDKDEDDDIKEYNPRKKSTPKSFRKAKAIDDDEDDEDIKIVDNAKTGIVPDLTKKASNETRQFDSKKESETKQIFVSKTKTKNNSDLESIPTIIAKEHIFDTDKGNFDEDVGIQMTFEGFDDTIETVPTIDEDLAEQILEERRRSKVDKFRLFGPDETDDTLGEQDVVDEDYKNKGEKIEFISSLRAKKKAINIKLIITTVVGIVLILFTAFKDSASFPSVFSSNIVYFPTAIGLYLIILATNFNVIIHGFNFKRTINSDFPISVTSILILAHTIALMLNQSLWIDNGVLLVSIGAFSLFLSQLGKRQMMIRIIDNFEFITSNDEKHTIENIANSVDAEIIARGINEENPIIKTSVKTDFPTNFLEISCKKEPADKVSKIIFFISIIASAILCVVVGLMDNFNTGINVGICAISISVPAISLFLTNAMLTNVSKALSKFGSRICGVEGAVMADNANIMVMEAADLFDKDSCDLHGVKTFNGAKIDDAIINTAAVIIQTKSPLSHVFDDVIIGKQAILPKVEDVIYEDRMGTSAWIYEKKVLVGNRDLLINHGVDVPKESYEQKYTIKGRKALYLAIDGQIIAMFIVSYSANGNLKRELKKLEKSGISIIVKSCDPYINEQSIAKLFGLPEGYISVMNHSSARVFDKYSGMSVEKSPAYAVHNGSALGFISAMNGAETIISAHHLLAFLESFGAALGFTVVAVLSIISAYNQLTAFNIMAFQVIWSGFMMLVSKLRGLTL